MVIAALAEIFFAACAFVYVGRLLRRQPTPTGERIGGFRSALTKLRRGEPMSDEELHVAAQVIAERRSLLAFSIPAAVFTIGCFYVLGSIELHGIHSLRIYIGLFPMLGSLNLTIQLLRVAVLKGRLEERLRRSELSVR
ncbi:hypothetical protein [Mycobacterium sp. Marseille-P9652]|uniref:hypothetical protein n=1 Tax=Mycobacterium sp. Marseille-P9652 TaxID=2654950 RepID=UPI00351A034A